MKQFGLIGKHLSHSFSPAFFADFFEKQGIDAHYATYELQEISDFPQLLTDHSFNGLNVTIPYKTEIIPFLDELDPLAEEIQAVNVVSFENGKAKGYNTDVFGFQQSIKPFLTFHHERALIFGTGGASKAVGYVFKSLGIDVIYVSQKPSSLSNHFTYADVNQHMISACKVIVNCTPLGMHPQLDAYPQMPFDALSEEHLLIDLIYNPSETLFMKQGRAHGATAMNGLSMLQHQALKSWEIWNTPR
ncbi:MAG: shikimate dehydrogenase family protein [Flavobacteriales bacterium]